MLNDSRNTRRQFLTSSLAGLAGLGSLIVVGGLPLPGFAAEAAGDGGAPPATAGFTFVQLSDLHIGFQGPKVNPEAEHTLERVVAAVNALPVAPAFVVVTGDLTHQVDDAAERLLRLQRVRDGLAGLKVPLLKVLPGEHDAALDQGAAFKQVFGPTHYSFNHQDVHFVVLDNVSDPQGALGVDQLTWLASDLKAVPNSRRIVVLVHRPLFDLAKPWDWYTRDGQQAIDLLMPFPDVTVFYGHIHQEHHATTGHIAHHAVRSPMFALPAPGSVPKKAPIPWDAAAPYAGLGWRTVAEGAAATPATVHEHLLAGG